MTELEAIVALNTVSSLGGVSFRKLLEAFGSPHAILAASKEKLSCVCAEKTAHCISLLSVKAAESQLCLAAKLGLQVVTFLDPLYPPRLREIYDPPPVLYIKGSLTEADFYSVAIVGSRRATLYGLENAKKFARELSESGFTVISGMARGIDTQAHLGVIEAGGRTVAVLGSGFAQVYPEENIDLCRQISQHGAVISEFPVETLPLRQNFPRRNRIISGLSLGVFVVEAARNSGALITARFALEQGREVFALPGDIDKPNSGGPNELIRDGAKPVHCVQDITSEFELYSGCHSRPGENATQEVCAGLSREESLIYSKFNDGPMHFDDIIEKTNIGITALSAILLKLQAAKLVRELPGKQFIRINHERKESCYSRVAH